MDWRGTETDGNIARRSLTAFTALHNEWIQIKYDACNGMRCNAAGADNKSHVHSLTQEPINQSILLFCISFSRWWFCIRFRCAFGQCMIAC